jgi:hypothetical protein
MLTGCETFSAGGPPPAGHNGVMLPRDCENLARNVDDPKVSPRSDPWRVIGQYAVALGEANGNIDATRECQGGQRERMSKGK